MSAKKSDLEAFEEVMKTKVVLSGNGKVETVGEIIKDRERLVHQNNLFFRLIVVCVVCVFFV